MALSATTTTGGQSTTQDPQVPGASIPSTEAGSNVQPGTATNILAGGKSIALGSPSLTTLSLNGTSSQTSVPLADSKSSSHHVNYALFGVSLLLLVVAAVLFWATGRTGAKNTTK